LLISYFWLKPLYFFIARLNDWEINKHVYMRSA
jgi:hypothetical protein